MVLELDPVLLLFHNSRKWLRNILYPVLIYQEQEFILHEGQYSWCKYIYVETGNATIQAHCGFL